jgi:hypothetical protein
MVAKMSERIVYVRSWEESSNIFLTCMVTFLLKRILDLLQFGLTRVLAKMVKSLRYYLSFLDVSRRQTTKSG